MQLLHHVHRTGLTLAFALASLGLTGTLPARADATVHVSLWDLGDESMAPDAKPMTPGMDMSGAKMGIKIDQAEVPAGPVTFEVTNDSLTMEHEMLVSAIPDSAQPLPYKASAQRVDERAAGSLGEVEETAIGKTGSLTLNLAPGRYILYCNIKGHYAMGMWTLLSVTG